ncbi:MAG TPA: polysaccharide deacetylase family protein [Gemmatimonadales bacterium]|nr:polysaccharide deacetylase family protein [Gemmatimonadales bacterium]
MMPLKRAVLGALAGPGSRLLTQPFRRGVGTIFMLHRFSDPDTGVVAHDPGQLRTTLAFLRRRGYELVSLGEMFRRLKDPGAQADLGVAFTLDDGYAEQVRVAGPIFAEFDCPATIFVTAGFLDRTIWFWWDRIEHIFQQSRLGAVQITIGGKAVSYQWQGGEGRAQACGDFVSRCKLVPNDEKLAAIVRLAQSAEVALPDQAPAKYAPMSWAELRAWEGRGMSFGPHTVTHPVLKRVGDAQSRQEIAGSWDRLRAEARSPVPVFCYPNGQVGDFGAREIATLNELRFEGAVVGTPGYADVAEVRAGSDQAFAVRRFSCPEDDLVTSKYVSGIERLMHGTGRS